MTWAELLALFNRAPEAARWVNLADSAEYLELAHWFAREARSGYTGGDGR